jgi:hypothetical protein
MFKTFSKSSFLAKSHLCPRLGEGSFPLMLNELANSQISTYKKKKSTETEFYTCEHNPARSKAIW